MYSFLGAIEADITIAVIFDYSAWAYVVIEETLQQAMEILGVSELRIKEICQCKNQSSAFRKPMKAVCAVRVPLLCRLLYTDQPVKFIFNFIS